MVTVMVSHTTATTTDTVASFLLRFFALPHITSDFHTVQERIVNKVLQTICFGKPKFQRSIYFKKITIKNIIKLMKYSVIR